MVENAEIIRLKKIYRWYADHGFKESKWDVANKGNQANLNERNRRVFALLQSFGYVPLTDKRILDVGSGTGEMLEYFADLGASRHNLYGIDLLEERIDVAATRFFGIQFNVGNAEQLQFRSASFDLVLLFTVFSSVLSDQMLINISAEVTRVLKPGGAVLWYDFRYNNPANPHVRGIGKRRIKSLFQAYDHHLQTVTLLPPLARKLGRFTPELYRILASIPFLRTHYLGLLIRTK